VPVIAAPPPAAADAAKIEALEAQLATEKERADKAEARGTDLRKKLSEVEKELKAARGRVETERRVYVVQKGELELANDRYGELRRRYDGLKKDHEELIEAVRQAAREEARIASAQQAPASVPAGADKPSA
jgi:colicin import membrane protein